MSKVSIIVRTRNEEYWLPKLLFQLKKQTFQDFELVVIDNQSTDATKLIFDKNWSDGRFIEIGNFKPGKAINLGIRESNSEYIVVISAHCVPTDEFWLENLLESFTQENIGAAYGRQLPLQTSDPFDKRDLLNTFGVEHRIQKKDTFFHNANSMFRRSVWEKYPFDEITPHIEDRIWAEHLIQNNIWIAYNPDAAVFHYHGINHHGNTQRAEAISEILSKTSSTHDHALPDYLSPELSNTLYCFLGHDKNTDPVLRAYIEDMSKNSPPGQVIVHTVDKDMVSEEGLDVFHYREDDTDKSFVEILAELLEYEAVNGFYPDSVAYVNLRADGLEWDNLNKALISFYDGMYETVFWARKEFSNVWQKDNGVYFQIREDYSKKENKEPVYISKYGLGLVTLPALVRNNHLVGKKIAILPLNEVSA